MSWFKRVLAEPEPCKHRVYVFDKLEYRPHAQYGGLIYGEGFCSECKCYARVSESLGYMASQFIKDNFNKKPVPDKGNE